jgi:cell division protease FtsH
LEFQQVFILTNRRNFLGQFGYREKMYSDVTAQAIDQEVRHLIDEAYSKAKKLISEHKEVIELMKDMLLEFETLHAEDIQAIVKGSQPLKIL